MHKFTSRSNPLARWALACAAFACAVAVVPRAPAQQLLDDIQLQSVGFGTGFRAGVEAAGRLFFPASRIDVGFELFVTDGTAAGSRLVRDIRAGAYASELQELTAGASRVWFSADDGVSGRELWISDGTAAGTRLVADLRPGAAGADPRGLIAFGTRLLFIADDGIHGRELWISDGTSAGTQLVLDLVPGAATSEADSLTQAGGRVVFAATDARGNREVWATDGTAAGSVPLTRFGVRSLSNPAQFVSTGTLAFFVAHDGLHGEELWVSDGTTAGTQLVLDIYPGIGRPLINELTPVGNRVFFASSGQGGMEPWVSDGTAAGTQLVADIRANGFGSSNPTGFTEHQSLVYFAANDDFDERELFASDGTPAGTSRLDVAPLGESSFPRAFGATARGMVFLATTRAGGDELFVTDGTPAGTAMLRDLFPGPVPGVYSFVGILNGEYYFGGFDGTLLGGELWATDGSSAGTRLVADLSPTPPGTTDSSSPGESVSIGGGVHLFAATSSTGRELWRTELAPGSTRLVLDIEPGPNDSSPANFVALDGLAIFSARDALRGQEPWRSDGTPAGTFPLIDLQPGPASSGPHDIARLGASVLVLARTAAGSELWRSDGTAIGTARLQSWSASFTRGFQVNASESRAYFITRTTNEGFELWTTDGTPSGTRIVADLQPGTGSAIAQPEGGLAQTALVLGDRLLFAADDGMHGNEIFFTDGTAAGTVLLGDLMPGAGSSDPRFGAVLGGVAYFAADSAAFGREMWRTDGTPAGTRLVHDTVPGPAGSNPLEFVGLDDAIVFSTFPSTGELAMWRSDGTGAGTVLLRTSTLIFRSFRRVGDSGVALFTDEDPAHGRELWRTDGTVAGTRLAIDFHTGPADGGAAVIGGLGRTLLLGAYDGVHGFEPWSLDFAAIGAAFAGNYGESCSGSGGRHPALRTTALPQPGRASFAIELSAARALSPAVLLLSPMRIEVPLGACHVLVDPTTLALPVMTDVAGNARIALPIPPLRALLGATMFAQAAVLDGGSAVGLAFSAGLEILIGD